MPFFKYHCTSADCGARQENLTRSHRDEDRPLCEACGKDCLKRVPAAGAFVLKGGGWYKDGYQKKE